MPSIGDSAVRDSTGGGGVGRGACRRQIGRDKAPPAIEGLSIVAMHRREGARRVGASPDACAAAK